MKKTRKQRNIEIALISGILVLVIIILGGLVCIYLMRQGEKENDSIKEPSKTITDVAEMTEPNKEEQEEQLTEIVDYLPENLYYGVKLPMTVFYDRNGRQIDLLKQYPGENLVLMYWGSWCPYCEEQLQHLSEMEQVLEQRNNTHLILINKTDAKKEETLEKAVSYLDTLGYEGESVFDLNLEAYKLYGAKRIPLIIVTDPDGVVRAMKADVIRSKEEFSELLSYAAVGGEEILHNFLQRNMINEKGGVYTNYLDKQGNSPKGHDVLSESMGLLMEYAVITENKELFDQSWKFVQSNMLRDNLVAWYVTDSGEAAKANAMLDDLRIAVALAHAHELWGGYEVYREQSEAMLSYNNYKGQLTSFYDFEQGLSGTSISLCYGDFEGMALLSKDAPKWNERKEKLKEIVEKGYIGDSFPLYYSSWDYKKQEYDKRNLNTAEALMTLYHLAKEDLIKETSIEWLLEQLEKHKLAAQYTVDGTVVSGFDYDSTAVYAIAALIGQECGNAKLYTLALRAMEKAKITDKETNFYGGFSYETNGEDMTAFDQLMPLLVYANFGNVTY